MAAASPPICLLKGPMRVEVRPSADGRHQRSNSRPVTKTSLPTKAVARSTACRYTKRVIYGPSPRTINVAIRPVTPDTLTGTSAHIRYIVRHQIGSSAYHALWQAPRNGIRPHSTLTCPRQGPKAALSP